MRKLILRFLFVFLAALMPSVVPSVSAQSIYDEFQADIAAKEKKFDSAYRVPGDANAFTRYRTYFNSSFGPQIASTGFSLKNFYTGGNIYWFWWAMLGVTAMFSFAQRFNGEKMDVTEMVIWSMKLLFLSFVFSAPGVFYATSMMLKNGFTLLSSQVFQLVGGTNSGESSVASRTLNTAASLGPRAQMVDNAFRAGVLDAVNQNIVNLHGDALPATMQIYNQLVTAINNDESIIDPQTGKHIRFPLAIFQDPAVSVTANGPVVSDRFDGYYTSMSGVVPDRALRRTDSAGNPLVGSIPPISFKASQLQTTTAVQTSSGPQTSVTEANNTAYDKLPASNFDEICRQSLPELLYFMLLNAPDPHLTSALKASQAYSYGQAIFNAAAADAIGRGIADVRNKKLPSAWDPRASTPNMVAQASIAAATGTDIPEQLFEAAAKQIRTDTTAAASVFLQSVFTNQYQNHKSLKVRQFYLSQIAPNPAGQTVVVVDAQGDFSLLSAGVKFFIDKISHWTRLAVIKLFTTIMDIVLELNIMLLWFSGPLWLFRKTEKGFGNYINGIFTGALTVPALAFLLTVWDVVVGIFIDKATHVVPGDGWVSTLANAALATQTVPIAAIVASVLSIVGIVGLAFVSPRVAKAFFEGGNALGAVAGAAIAASLAAGAALAGAATGGVSTVASSAAGKAISAKASGAVAGVKSRIGSALGSIDGGQTSNVAGDAAAPKGDLDERDASAVNNAGLNQGDVGLSVAGYGQSSLEQMAAAKNAIPESSLHKEALREVASTEATSSPARRKAKIAHDLERKSQHMPSQSGVFDAPSKPTAPIPADSDTGPSVTGNQSSNVPAESVTTGPEGQAMSHSIRQPTQATLAEVSKARARSQVTAAPKSSGPSVLRQVAGAGARFYVGALTGAVKAGAKATLIGVSSRGDLSSLGKLYTVNKALNVLNKRLPERMDADSKAQPTIDRSAPLVDSVPQSPQPKQFPVGVRSPNKLKLRSVPLNPTGRTPFQRSAVPQSEAAVGPPM